MARSESAVSGVLVLDKPPGPTSHDVVSAVRRLTGQRRTGHAGTLDPAAAGVLVVCLGQATRAAEYLLAQDKEYRAEVTFGRTTDTLDGVGRVLTERDASGLSREAVEEALGAFRGQLLQVPPAVSAIKVGGQRLYELARQGREIQPEPRPVTIHRLELVDFEAGPRPRAMLDVACSKGTYIRSLARDLGEALGPGAFLSFLLRRRSGAFRLEEAISLEELAAAVGEGRLDETLLTLDRALAHLPRVEITPAQAEALAHGRQPSVIGLGPAGEPAGEGLFRLSLPGGELVAVAESGSGGLRLVKVFSGSGSAD